MNSSRIVGLLVLIGGVVLQPVGWMFSHWLTPISFAAIVVGILLLLRSREHGSTGDGSASGGGMPGDIHGYSGQMSGGRSTSWESNHSSSSGGSDSGGSGD
jgi:hypothetical protein